MPLLVHIAPEPRIGRIRRAGLQPTRLQHWIDGCDRFVWAFPVLESYTLSHQWARELKRKGVHTLIAVTFRVGDAEQVFARHFRETPRPFTASAAIGHIRAAASPLGYEILLPRRVLPKEITRIRVLPQAIGWRYWPEAKSQDRWPCECPMCAPRGEVKAQRYRQRLPQMQQRWEAKRRA
jgi:hypothetical protein